jgi:hypothetical protein
MACNEINGLNSILCTKTMSGIKRAWIIPFSQIGEYTYTDDYLQLITGYSAVSLPVMYRPNEAKSEYKGVYNQGNYRLYDHSLVLSFPKMEKEKREELQSLEAMEVTIIFKDRNDQCWIMGQDFPAKLTQVNQGTGVKNGENSYEFTFTSSEKQHLREITCPSEGCFSSFSVSELRKSDYRIKHASTLAWAYLELGADDRQTNYTPIPPIQPTLWNSDPVVYANDYARLLALFESMGTVVSFDIYYVAPDDVLMTVYSTDTSYSAFLVDNTAYNGQVTIDLNFTTVLSPPIANSGTTILLTDSAGIVFDLGYGLPVGITGYDGTTNSFTVDVTTLYPTGTTFTLSLSNQECSDVIYQYLYEGTIGTCYATNAFEFYKGNSVKISVPTISHDGDTPRFQNIHLTLNGNVFSMYQEFEDWHSDSLQFQTDFTILMGTIFSDINPSSLVFTDYGTYVDIKFVTQSIVNDDANPFFKPFVRGYETPTPTTLGWTQSRALNLFTFAPYPSILTVSDTFTNEVIGENLVNITSNDFTLSPLNSTSNESVDNLGIVWGFDGTIPYDEESLLVTAIDSEECLIGDLETTFERCYESFTSEQLTSFEIINLDCTSGDTILGADFTIEYNNGSYHFDVISLPLAVTPSSNMQYLTKALNDIKGMNVIYMDYNPVTRKYFIHLEIENTFSLLSFTETTNGRSFDLGTIIPIYLNSTNRVNPYVEMEWSSLPTIFPIAPMPSVDMMYGFWNDLASNSIAVRFIWDSTGDTITLDKLAIASTVESNFVVSLHETYPTTTNAVAVYELPSGVTTNITFTGITAELIASGSSVADVNFMLYTNYLGWGYVQPLDMTADEDYFFQESNRLPLIWGTMDYLKYLGTTGTTVAPTITSVVCTETCCDDGFTPDSENTILGFEDQGSNTYNITIGWLSAIPCDVDYIQMSITPFTIPNPSPATVTYNLGACVDGIRTYDPSNLVEFDGNPSGETFTFNFGFYDILGNLLYNFFINQMIP